MYINSDGGSSTRIPERDVKQNVTKNKILQKITNSYKKFKN